MLALLDNLRKQLRLKKDIRRHAAQATQNMINAIVAPVDQPNETKLTEADRLHWVNHFLSLDANPNARHLGLLANVPDAGHYPLLEKPRSVLSHALYYPSVVRALMAAGADFDRSTLEMAVYMANYPHFVRITRPNLAPVPFAYLAPSIAELINAKTVSARLSMPFVDLSDRKIKSAGEILSKIQPILSGFIEGRSLEEYTPPAPNKTPKKAPRL